MKKHYKVTYRGMEGKHWIAQTEDKHLIKLNLSLEQAAHWGELSSCCEPGNAFYLLNVGEENEDPACCEAEFIVFEPDYLVDISSLAECFKPYGAHPLNYTLARLQRRENTASIFLGNTANYFIDELINERDDSPVDYLSAIKGMFQTSAFEFSTCSDLNDAVKEKKFFADAQKHFDNIRKVTADLFPHAGIDREDLLLEPSFISHYLGLQGRLDIMQADYSGLIELKSGKGNEDYRTGQFIRSAENHYIQMILYLATLEFNLDQDPDSVRSYLLYSRYPLLSKERHSRKHLWEALALRNKIVAIDYAIQRKNSIDYTRRVLSAIDADKLNTKGLSGRFFDNYLSPAINKFNRNFRSLDPTEQEYILRLYTFLVKDMWFSKVGEREYEGVKRASTMWHAPFEEKLLAGEILYGLRISCNQAAEREHTIELSIPAYEDLYLPNFREGDLIVLYQRNEAEDTINNRQVFKGAIERLESERIVIRLRTRQRNPQVWNPDGLYAIEHDYMDATYNSMFRSLIGFMEANKERRDLLLARRNPDSIYQDLSEEDDLQRITDKALASQDAFLLVGPPGTGKTSMALSRMVNRVLSDNPEANILLLAYTNRAVDEICKTLSEREEEADYIRIGNELNCAPEHRNHLLERKLKPCSKRKEVIAKIKSTRIFVGTVASVWAKQELFHLKSFDMAIIDEATQLLDIHLTGLLAASNQDGQNAVRRFVLIGDHKQLPAVVLQTEEESSVQEPALNELGITNLKDSLFERLYRQYRTAGLTYAYDFLSKQGRMHPAIAAFPSQYFYDNLLRPVGLSHQQEESTYERLAFYDIQPSSEDTAEKANLGEAKQVVRLCLSLQESAQNIGIITPFRNQIALIRKLLQESGLPDHASILVDTVERFQGSQRDFIIYSFCIKTTAQLAALPNILREDDKIIDRKLNVALTRARKRLYIIGNKALLSKDALYKQLISHIND